MSGEPRGELKAELGLLDATMINVGTMVASAIFIVPATIAVRFSGVFPTILVWVVGGLVSLCGALCVAELGAAMPKAGGQFVYLKRAYGPVWGYLYGWGSAVIINPASIAAIAVLFATYLDYFAIRLGAPLGQMGINVVAVVSIMGLTVVNCFGVKLGALIQNVMTIAKIAAVLGIVAICFILPGGSPANWEPFWPVESWTSLIGTFGVAAVATLWAYDGWIEITYVGSEMKRPGRDMPLAIIISTLLVAGLYVATTIGLTYVLGLAGVGRSERVVAEAATTLLGPVGASVVSAVIIVSVLGSNNGIVFTSARIPYVMAKEGQFFRWAGQVSDRYSVPTIALVTQGLWSSVLVFSGTYEQLATYVVFVGFLFYAMSAAAVIILRKREPGMPRPYRTWGYPLTPIVFIVFAALLIINAIIETPLQSAIGVGILLLGLVLYRGLGWHRASGAPAEGE